MEFVYCITIDSLQPYTEDIINGVNVNTITPPMLAHGLLTPEHGEYFFNPHVISTEKQRKLGFLIITLSEECAQIFLQCLKNTRDYAPHDDLLKKIEDGKYIRIYVYPVYGTCNFIYIVVVACLVFK